jgi:mono/diheme cytochrome c family protein
VRRAVLILFFALLLAGCGGEKVVSPTGPVEGPPPPPPAKAVKGDPAAGKTVYNDNGCGGCHTFQAAGSTGAVGPNLDETLTGKSAAYIETAITSPDAEIAAGYQAGVMPQDYASELEPKQIADLVAFLQTGS